MALARYQEDGLRWVPLYVFLLVSGVLLTACVSSRGENEVPRHSWGDPNLQGNWDYRTATPLAAPQAIGDRTHFTEAKKIDFEKKSAARGLEFVHSVGNFVGDEPWADRSLSLTEDNRAALIIDPADGRLPPRTDSGKK